MHQSLFQQVFQLAPQAEASAPGRVNLLGEHTDYNNGFVLPTAIPQQTTVSLGFSPDHSHHFYSEALDQSVSLTTPGSSPAGFARYLFGCLRVLAAQGLTIPPLNVAVRSTVPIGVGLSSSAALEVAMLRGVRSLLQLDLDQVRLAQLGQQAEQQYAGVQCGIMDQMAASLADPQHLLFLDTRTLHYQLLPFPPGTEIIVLDSGTARNLAGSGYNQRRAESAAAAAQLGVQTLREITELEAIAPLPFPLQQRARHVITENARVLAACQSGSATRFGELMNASHSSLRDDYAVSTPALDQLVKLLQATPGVFGAKLTGAGFGGACVALVTSGQGGAIAALVLDQYNQQGNQGRILVPPEGPEP